MRDIDRWLERLTAGNFRSEAEIVTVAWGSRAVIADILRERARSPELILETVAPRTVRSICSYGAIRVVARR